MSAYVAIMQTLNIETHSNSMHTKLCLSFDDGEWRFYKGALQLESRPHVVCSLHTIIVIVRLYSSSFLSD